jgi:hypothetical protein
MFCVGKGGQCLGGMTVLHSCGDCLEKYEKENLGTLKAYFRHVRGLLYLYLDIALLKLLQVADRSTDCRNILVQNFLYIL